MKRPSRRQFGLWLLVGAAVVLGARPLHSYLTRPPVRYTVRVVGTDGEGSNVFALNNRGEVLGLISLGRDSVYYFIERNGQTTRIPDSSSHEFRANRKSASHGGDLYEMVMNKERDRFGPTEVAADGTRLGRYPQQQGVWRNGKAVVLPVLPGWDKGTPEAINQRGQIVGTCWRLDKARIDEAPDPSEDPRACLWENGTVRDLGAIEKKSWAEDINEQGQAVGHCLVRRWSVIERMRGIRHMPHAALFEDGKALNLNLLIPRRSGWVLQGAKAINDKGQILGIGRYRGQRRGFVLTPVEPGQ